MLTTDLETEFLREARVLDEQVLSFSPCTFRSQIKTVVNKRFRLQRKYADLLRRAGWSRPYGHLKKLWPHWRFGLIDPMRHARLELSRVSHFD